MVRSVPRFGRGVNTDSVGGSIPNRYSVILDQRLRTEITEEERIPKSLSGERDFSDSDSETEPESNHPGDTEAGCLEAEEEQSNQPGDLPAARCPGGWVENVRGHDPEVTRVFASIFPKDPSPLQNEAVARKYYRKRRTGALSAKEVALIAAWHRDSGAAFGRVAGHRCHRSVRRRSNGRWSRRWDGSGRRAIPDTVADGFVEGVMQDEIGIGHEAARRCIKGEDPSSPFGKGC